MYKILKKGVHQTMKNINDSANDKLIILYILNQLDLPITNSQLMKVVLENRFMNYFTYQQTINELLENDLIQQTESTQWPQFSITSKGQHSLELFSNLLPLDIENFVKNNIKEIKTKLKSDSLIDAKIIEENGSFMVNCNVRENDFSLIEINLTVGTRSDAQRIVNNWKNNSQPIYAEIIHSLTQIRE
jgi:predicted transcriptional regulator